MADETNLSTIIVVIVALAVLVPLIGMVAMMSMVGVWGGHMWDGGMWNGGMGNGAGAPWLWLVTWLAVLALVAGGGYLLYRSVNQSEEESVDSALEELRLAYARGELSDEEFEQRRERLRREK